MWWHNWEWRAKVPSTPWLDALMILIGGCVMLPVWVIIAVFAFALWWVLGALWVGTTIVIIAELIENAL